MPVKLEALVLSDIHLGHRRNQTRDIIKHLDQFFDYYSKDSQFTKLDILFIAGDLFDSLLDFASDDIHESVIWLGRLLKFCSSYKIKLRILEGTPSHDWKQSRILETAGVLVDFNVDYKYIDRLYIEYMEDLDIRILYVPDEWTANPDLTFNQVQTLLKEEKITEVDLAIMHGVFSYQMRNVPGHHQTHNETHYLGIVKHFIAIGHHHCFSTYDKIIAQGSFDRLAHGEEEPKGGVLLDIDPINGNRFHFIENKNAKQFKTIELKTKDLDKSLLRIEKQIKHLLPDAYVRIKCAKDHPVYIAFEEVKRKYPEFNFSKISFDEIVEEQQKESFQLSDTYNPISITKDNIVTLLMAEINSKYNLTVYQKQLLINNLETLNT